LDPNLASIDTELIKPYSISLQKLRSGFRIGFRAQTSAQKQTSIQIFNTHKKAKYNIERKN
jgi:hypothetical protein